MKSMYIALIILAGIGVYFICREVMCWYWKINKIVMLLENIDKKLGIIINGPDDGNASNNAGWKDNLSFGEYKIK